VLGRAMMALVVVVSVACGASQTPLPRGSLARNLRESAAELMQASRAQNATPSETRLARTRDHVFLRYRFGEVRVIVAARNPPRLLPISWSGSPREYDG
jgi:hypothetical protein